MLLSAPNLLGEAIPFPNTYRLLLYVRNDESYVFKKYTAFNQLERFLKHPVYAATCMTAL